MSNSTLVGNSASSDGGGIYNSGIITVSNSTLVANEAGRSGDNIYNANGSTSIFYDNRYGNRRD
ncbi:hypothetical protein F7734_19245 [Scytonema sp. UIC 10036]|uniref:hypothetical protein n=1 Tax=Scytonema sp. UIC 10036 TaxID=2304196 RepID=UPI0012DABA47|nr:hypothetical protein [Scytonema sp. UIC 10036]MUG94393.1 hypothetical protein [Scytonema sp. UIC 10036]